MSGPLYGSESLWRLVERRAEATPDGVMLRDDLDRTLTFEQFRARAERVAAGLAELGIGEGTRVCWQLPTRIESVVLAFALARLGARQTPVIPIYPEREVGYVLRESAAEFVITPGVWREFDFPAMARGLIAALPEPTQRPQLLVYDHDLPEAEPSQLGPHRPADVVRWVYYTSGTTSDPKGVQHTDRSLLAGAESLAVAWGATADDVAHFAMPFAHIAGPDILAAALSHGFCASLSQSYVPAQAVLQCRRDGVTLAGGSTAYYLGFLSEQHKQPGTVLVPTLKALFGGGAPSSPAIVDAVRAEMGVKVLHGYGMTECPMIAQGRVTDTDDQLRFSDGHPVRDAEVAVKAPGGDLLPPLVDGEICVRGPVVFAGYTDPTLDTFDEDGWFHTGDVGHLREDGHVVLTDRLKDIIIRKGENISAKEVEDVIYTHRAVEAVAVIGLPDADRGERVCAVVEPRPGAAPPTLADVFRHCRDAGMMTQKIPEQLEIVTELPRNATLKILKSRLRAQLTATGNGAGASAAARGN